MLTRHSSRRRKLIAALVLVGFLACGYASNHISRITIYRDLTHWLLCTVMGNRTPFEVRTADATVRQVADEIAAECNVPLAKNDDDAFVKIDPSSLNVIPFIISVDYFWQREFEIGGGAKKWYFTWFGEIYCIGETDEYVT